MTTNLEIFHRLAQAQAPEVVFTSPADIEAIVAFVRTARPESPLLQMPAITKITAHKQAEGWWDWYAE